MTDDIMKNFQEFNKATINATKELVELNGRLMGKVLESQVELANLYIEGGEKQLEATKDVSDPQDFVKKQSAIMEEYTNKLSSLTESNIKLAQQAGEELKNWLNRNLKTAEKK
jgi:hypothetical protein